MKSAFDKIAAGLEDAIAFAGGDAGRGRIAAPIDVKAIVARTGKTQVDFARAYRLPVRTVQEWAQRRRTPDAPARALLALIDADPAAVEKLLENAG